MKASPPSLRDVLEHYGVSVPYGSGWVSLRCPVHEDRHASARALLEDETGEYLHCHGCGFNGDAWELIKSKEGLDGFAAAVAYAKEHFGDSDGPVRKVSGGRSNLPGRSGSGKSRGGRYIPPWVRGRPTPRA